LGLLCCAAASGNNFQTNMNKHKTNIRNINKKQNKQTNINIK